MALKDSYSSLLVDDADRTGGGIASLVNANKNAAPMETANK
jgi:hypothetical protein